MRAAARSGRLGSVLHRAVDLLKILLLCTVSAGDSYATAFTPISSALSPASAVRSPMASARLDLVLTMNAPVIHDVLLSRASDEVEQPSSPGEDRRFIWESCFGPVLIEIVGGDVFVNGSRVEPAVRSDAVRAALKA